MGCASSETGIRGLSSAALPYQNRATLVQTRDIDRWDDAFHHIADKIFGLRKFDLVDAVPESSPMNSRSKHRPQGVTMLKEAERG